ncbi:Disco-interacting protein 2-like C [Stylophora pistillata]|uniref:Disco-interacting protein 2-like C n=1 Tax=Stylophora pistillata TaxID=50429 RepID=A0A2B4SBT5_STYPI|nr:Disco-interacting protein 2-like C [Stylophora pistillata]
MAVYKRWSYPRNIRFNEPLLRSRPASMTEPPESSLPPQVLEKLRELNTELAEGDITQKGYEKKRAKLLDPYLSRDSNVASPSSPNMNDHYSAVQRSEALQVALAKRLNTQDEMPAPFKRQSLMRRKPMENGTQPQLLRGSVSSQDSIGNQAPNEYTPPGSVSSRTSIPRAGSEEFPSPPSDMYIQHRHSTSSFPPVTPPPDLTRQGPFDTKGSRVMHMSSVRTIEDDGQVSATKPDPNAPRPEGQTLRPVNGEFLELPEELPKNLEEALSKFATRSPKAPCFSVVDNHGKTNVTLSYGKLLSRSMKLAYALLNKVGSHNEGTSVMTGDRVALVYQSDDPINFITSFYGCLIAGIIPVPIEPPASKDFIYLREQGWCSGWPKLQWFVTANLNRHPKDWQPPSNLDRSSPAYIESTVGKDGAVMGVTVTRMSMNLHAQVLSQACLYTEGEIMISVLDPKREVGLWHSILTSVMNGMHVIYVPPSVLDHSPNMWLQMVTKHRATCALVSSRNLHWSLHANKDIKDVNLGTIRFLLLAGAVNPWSLSACDSFVNAFEAKGLKPEALCPCASSTETMTVALRRPGKPGTTATGRGVLSLSGLSYGVVRVDKEGSLTSLTLQDCGTVLPGAKIAVVKLEGPPYLCKSDEVGELCISSGATGSAYWGLAGKTNQTFKVQPTLDDGAPFEQYPLSDFVRTGLLGFLGPGGLVFVCGTADGLIKVSGRRHNSDDLKATILAVDPVKFVYRGSIAIFSLSVLKDDRIVVVAEQRPQCTEEESFQWMSHVLPSVDSIHNVGIYCLCLVASNGLPKTSSGAVHIHETRQKFMEGSLHPANILMCPETCVTNLPQPRQKHPEPGPAATMVGNIVMGTRIGGAAGREIADKEEDSDMARKSQFLAEILKWRAQTLPDHVLFTLMSAKGTVSTLLTTTQLHKRAERVAQMAVEQGRLSSGDNVALLFTPGVDFIVAVFACLYADVTLSSDCVVSIHEVSVVYSGHHTILIPPGDLETNPALWLSVVSQYKVRDTFCSYPVMDLCTKGLGQSIPALKSKGVNLTCVRNCVVVAEERPRINLTTAFSTLFSGLGLSPRAVSTSFGCRTNVAICTQGASTPEASSVYVDTRALRNDRVTLVERGSPHSLCLLESGKILPGVKVVIANPETKGMCADSHLGEIWVTSPHNGSGYFMTGEDTITDDRFNVKLTTGNVAETAVQYARTGYLGFIKRTDFTQTDGARHDALFVVGPLEETMILRGMRYHPVDIENTVTRCHRAICESAVFTMTNLLVVAVELDADEREALDVVPLVTTSVLNEQQLVVGVVVVIDPGVVPINSRGEKQRMHLRDGFLGDQLDPIYVAYNM